jgi:hypothetical protein
VRVVEEKDVMRDACWAWEVVEDRARLDRVMSRVLRVGLPPSVQAACFSLQVFEEPARFPSHTTRQFFIRTALA